MRRTIRFITSIFIAAALSLSVKAQVGLSIPQIQSGEGYVEGDTVKVPVYADSSLTGRGALALTMRLTYDDYYMVPLSIDTDTTIIKDAGWSVTPNLSTPDVITLAAAGTNELSGSGVLFYINFRLQRQGTGYLYIDANNTFFNESVEDIPISIPSYGYISIAPKPTISVSFANSVIVLGDSVQAFVSGQENPVTWSVTDTTKASVRQNGMVHSKAHGIVGIVAEDNRGVIDTTNLRILGFRLSGEDTTNFQGQEVAVHINASDLTTLNALSGSFFMNTAVQNNFEVLSVEPGELLDPGASISYDIVSNGISFAFAQTTYITGAGRLLTINLRYSESVSFNNYTYFTDVLINEELEGGSSPFYIRSNALPNLSISNNSLPRYLVGDSLQFSVSNNNGPVTWNVSNPALATIDSNGKLISTGGGSFFVSAEDSIGATANIGNFTFYDVFVQFPDTSMILSDTIYYPVRISNLEHSNSSILSGDLTFSYNNSNLNYLGYSTSGALSDGWSFAENQLSSTQIKLVGGSASSIEQSGDFLYLMFKADISVNTDQYSYLYINDVLFNEGEPNYTKDDGQIFISSKPLTPALISPSNGEQSISLNPTLDWGIGVGADSYDVQVSLNGSFAPSFIDTSGVLTDELMISGLSGSTFYYWRVRSVSNGGTSNWSPGYYFKTQDPAPAAPILSSPADGSTNTSVTPVIYWNSTTFATNYRIEVSTASDFSSLVLDSTVSSSQTNILLPGLLHDVTYYWRVFAFNSTGESPASESRSFTTIVKAPKTPVLIIPQDSITQADTVAFFSWNQSERATSYTLQITTTEDFSVVDYNKTGLIDTVTKQEHLDHLTRYYWRVKALNIGGESDWSPVRTFETKAKDAKIPNLLSPANNKVQVDTATTFIWNTSEAAIAYRLQVSSDPAFSTLISNLTGLIDTTAIVNGFAKGATYYWRVKAFGLQDSTAWSTTFTFTTVVELPATPVPASPADNASQVNASPQLFWFNTARADSFLVQWSESSDFTSDVYEDHTNDTSVIATGLTPFTSYFWRVKAYNLSGESSFSSVFSFKTAADPAPLPVLISPLDNATAVDTTVTLTWVNNSSATGFQAQLSTMGDFNAVTEETSGTDTMLTVSGLNLFTNYYWRVRSIGFGGDTSAWSSVFTFTTKAAELPAPVLLNPGNASVDVPDSVTFMWSMVPGADGYLFELDRDTSTVERDLQINKTDTSETILNLTNSMNYLWRVKATDSTVPRESVWTPWFSFTVVEAPNLPPIVVSEVKEYTFDEDFSTLTAVKLDTVFNDPEAQPLTFEIVSSTDLIISTLEGDSLIFESVQDTSGSGLIIVKAVDDIGQEVIDTLTITVNPVNDLPYVVHIPDTLTFSVGEVLKFTIDTAFADVEDQLVDLQFNLTVDPTDIFISFDPGTYTVSLTSPSYTGFGSINLTVTDSDGGVLQIVLVVEVKMATSNELENGVPFEYSLQQNYPNPFNPSSTIRFGIPEAAEVQLTVYNMLGQMVGTLLNQKMQAGWHTVQFNAEGLSTGTYIYRIQAGKYVSTKKMLLIK